MFWWDFLDVKSLVFKKFNGISESDISFTDDPMAWVMLARESIVARSLWRARYARLPPPTPPPPSAIVVYIPPLKNWTYFQLMLSCPYGGDFN